MISCSKQKYSKAQSLSIYIINRSHRAVNERRLNIMAVYGVIYVITNKLDGMEYVGQTTRSVKVRF